MRKQLVTLRSGETARKNLDDLGWIAQSVATSFVEVTGHYFIQGSSITIQQGVDVIAAWADPIPRLVEVQLPPGTVTTVQITAPSTVYTGMANSLSSASGSGTVITLPTPTVPAIFSPGGFVYLEVHPWRLGNDAGYRLTPTPWYYKEGSFAFTVDANAIPTTFITDSSTPLPGSLSTNNRVVTIPVNGGRSNIAGASIIGGCMNTSSTYDNTQRMSAFAYYQNNGGLYSGTNRRPWMLQGTLDPNATNSGWGYIFAYVEVPFLHTPGRGVNGGTSATALTNQIVRGIYAPVSFPMTTGSPAYSYKMAAFCPGWVPSPGNTIIATILNDYVGTVGTYGAGVMSFGSLLPDTAYPTTNNVRIVT